MKGAMLQNTDDEKPTAFSFGEFRIDSRERALYRGQERIRIQRKPLRVLTYLVQQAPRMVPREELLQKFWSKAVNEESLTRCISTIRRLLDDNQDSPKYLETHHAQGYRFIAGIDATAGTGATRRKSNRLYIGLATAVLLILAALFVSLNRTSQTPVPPAQELIDRIAVLPVVVDIPDQPWLVEALTDHVMRAVSRVEGVTVVASPETSRSVDPVDHGQRLNVDALLLTRLERESGVSRLNAQLVGADDGALLWHASFDSPTSPVGGEQVEDLARQVALRLRPTLQLPETVAPVDERAYAAYLRGRYHWSQRSAASLEAAIAAFETALTIAPDYSDAMVGAAESWLLLPLYGANPPTQVIPGARLMAQRALESNPRSARARAVLGFIALQYDWDWLTAEKLLREAVTLNPNDATAQQWLGELYCYSSRFDACRKQLRIALELDPLAPVLVMQQGTADLYSGAYEAAVLAYSESTESFPGFAMGQYALGLAYAGLGDWDLAIAAYRTSLPELGLAIAGGPMIFALARSGQTDQAAEMLRQLEALAETRYVPPSKLAVAYLGLDDRAQAIEWLRLAVEMHDDRLIYFGTDVHFRALLAEPGFRDIADRVGPQGRR
jgi:serine/threonine-protein kinase